MTNTPPPTASDSMSVLVPREPTREMCIAAAERTGIPLTAKGCGEVWSAMIAATPKASTLDADRERIARIIELAIIRHGVPEADLEGTLDDADAIRLASPNASRGGDASYWLIELRGTPPLWSTSPTAPTGLGGFKSDVMHAHRYPTKTAAQDHLRRMPKQDRDQCFVSEHMDVGMPAQTRQ